MAENESKPVTVNVNRTTETDFFEAAVVVCIFVSSWLCWGDPDLLDAIILFLVRA